MKYFELRLIENCLDDDSIRHLSNVNQPKTLLKHRIIKFCDKVKQLYILAKKRLSSEIKTIDSLDSLSIGEYLLLTTLSGERLVYNVFSILYGFSKVQVDNLDAEDVFGVINFVRSEIVRINKLFESTRISPKPEEEKAGVKQLGSVGTFSVIDYISRRQGITIEQAEKMRWKVVLALMMIDKEAEEYKRRLEQEYRNNVKKR